MENAKNNSEPNEKKDIVVVEPKPITREEKTDKKIGNVRIDNLNLRIITGPLNRHYQKYYKENKIHLVVDIALAAIVVLLLGSVLSLWLFSRAKLVNLVDFKIVSAPENLVNGQEAEFTIDYANTTNTELTDAVLVLKLPASLKNPRFGTKEFDLKTNSLAIGNLASKAHGEIKVSGTLLGNLNDKQEFVAVINYKNKYGQDRQEYFSQDFQITKSTIETKITLPEKITATSPFDATISLKNNSDLTLTNLKIKLIAPDGFTLIKSDLGDTSEQTWPLVSWLKGVERQYNFTGKFYLDQAQKVKIKEEIYGTYNNQEYLLSVGEAESQIEISKLILEFLQPEKNQFANPGDKITYNLHYKNTGTSTLKNVVIGLELKGDYASQKNYAMAKFDELAPNQEGTAQITAGINDSISFSDYNEDGYNIEARITASYDNIVIESSALITKLSSSIKIDTAAVFFTSEGDQIGVGAVPPKVGETTSYWAVIKIINTNNKIKNLKVIAQLPDGVDFTDIYNVTAGDQIVYHEDSRQIEWQVEEMPALAGYYNPAPEARIELAITPTKDQVGQSPTLLSSISASATDETTSTLLTATGANITTIISSNDSQNKVVE